MLDLNQPVVERAKEIENSYSVHSGIYLVGSFEKGVTVYKQQVRAHNLAWALWELVRHQEMEEMDEIAVVGGGIAGLTLAACLLSRFDDLRVCLFEKLWDLCPYQQGCDNRWLHPKIYDWPYMGTRVPGASLPVLNWQEGRASDVAKTILREFHRFADYFDSERDRLRVILGLGHIRITAETSNVDWIGVNTERKSEYFQLGEREGNSKDFDAIVVTSGFGIETTVKNFPTNSYWRNEQIGQPVLDGSRQRYLISGYGDGALVDLFRLSIERFRQDTILVELFGDELVAVEKSLSERWPATRMSDNLFSFFESNEESMLSSALERLSSRVRKDTEVVLHIRGKSGDNKSFSDIFGPNSSFLSRMLTYLLYRCGGFAISFDELKDAVSRNQVPNTNVLCRYGANTKAHLASFFVDFEEIEDQIEQLIESQSQVPQLAWEPGVFRTPK